MKMTITSHTIVRNGMPFIVPVLKAVSPLMSKMLVTISDKSDDGTKEAILALNDPKIEIDYENVANLSELTNERQKQVDKTDTEWILFLDDDDFWDIYELDNCIHELDSTVDALAVNPYQVVDKESYDTNWWNKWFTKIFRNENINYRGGWPEDWIYKGDQILYWKKNPRVKKSPYKFYHLANIKPHSFRKDELPEYKYPFGVFMSLDNPLPKEIGDLI